MASHDTRSLLEWVPRLRRYARALCLRPEDADDLVQDTLERAWSRSAQWPAVLDMRAWLFSVMHHLHVDALRRARLVTTPLEDAELPTLSADGPAGLLLDLEAALRHLSAEHREVLVLVAVEQMTYAEVAGTLGVPLGTVMSRLGRARERLRMLMEHGAPAAPASVPVPLKRVK